MTRARDVANIDGLLTTTGDTYYASAAGTPARLGIGSTSQVLTVASGVPSWATPASGGLTVIGTGTLSGTSVVIGSIPGTYKHLMVSVYGATFDTGNTTMQLRYNSVTSNYSKSLYGHNGTTATNEGTISQSGWGLNDGATDWLRTGASNHANWIIYNYNNTTGLMNASGTATYINSSSANSRTNGVFSNSATAAAVTSVTIRLDAGYNMTAGTYTVYGVS